MVDGLHNSHLCPQSLCIIILPLDPSHYLSAKWINKSRPLTASEDWCCFVYCGCASLSTSSFSFALTNCLLADDGYNNKPSKLGHNTKYMQIKPDKWASLQRELIWCHLLLPSIANVSLRKYHSYSNAVGFIDDTLSENDSFKILSCCATDTMDAPLNAYKSTKETARQHKQQRSAPRVQCVNLASIVVGPIGGSMDEAMGGFRRGGAASASATAAVGISKGTRGRYRLNGLRPPEAAQPLRSLVVGRKMLRHGIVLDYTIMGKSFGKKRKWAAKYRRRRRHRTRTAVVVVEWPDQSRAAKTDSSVNRRWRRRRIFQFDG